MVYKVAIVGHSQVPMQFPNIPGVEVRIFRRPGAKLEAAYDYTEFRNAANWNHNHTILFIGGNDIGIGPLRQSVDQISTNLIQLCWHFHSSGSTVSLVLIEPRTFPVRAVHKNYKSQADRINRKLKRYARHSQAPYHTINLNATPFREGHTGDGTHFNAATSQHIIAKMQNAILWQKDLYEANRQS